MNRYSLQKEGIDLEVSMKPYKYNGFQVTPKNEIHYAGIEVNQMTLINASFIEKVIKKKIKKRLDSYMNYMIYLLEESDDTDSGDVKLALNDLERLKTMIKNKYRFYLEEKYVELLMKKINLLERELKMKKYYLENQKTMEEVKGKSR